jgi:hypothetical protein
VIQGSQGICEVRRFHRIIAHAVPEKGRSESRREGSDAKSGMSPGSR